MDQEPKEEMVDVVDKRDNTIGIAPRKGIHSTKLLHRAVHIFLIDWQGRLWLGLRGQNTEILQGYYSSSAAGHVRHGESYLEGARREAFEETGIPNLNLEEQHKFTPDDKTLNEFLVLYVAKSGSIPTPHDEAEKIEAFTMPQIDQMIANGKKVSPIFAMLFEWYKRNSLC